MTTSGFYGLGFAFPPAIDPSTGGFAIVGDDAIVAQALRVLLRTAPGERLMLPTYGCDLRRFLFAPNTLETHRLIASEISRAISTYEDRATLTAVIVSPDAVEPAQVNIEVRYTLSRTGTPGVMTDSLQLQGTGG
jgi:phage baseplate assembly protein W